MGEMDELDHATKAPVRAAATIAAGILNSERRRRAEEDRAQAQRAERQADEARRAQQRESERAARLHPTPLVADVTPVEPAWDSREAREDRRQALLEAGVEEEMVEGLMLADLGHKEPPSAAAQPAKQPTPIEKAQAPAKDIGQDKDGPSK
jgi:hypothetical protein